MSDAPSTSAEMLPRRLYVAEVVTLPFFWLGPLLALVLGGAMALDVRELAEHDVTFGRVRYLWYLAPLTIGHLGSLGYRMNRRKQIRHHLGLTPTEMSHLMERLDPPKGYAVRGLLVLQGLFPVVVLLQVDLPDALAVVLVALFAFALLVSPFAVWLDLRNVRAIPEVQWGWPRHLHVAVSIVPFAVTVYLLQRQQHLYHALFVRVWDADLSGVAVPDGERSTLQRLVDRFDRIGP